MSAKKAEKTVDPPGTPPLPGDTSYQARLHHTRHQERRRVIDACTQAATAAWDPRDADQPSPHAKIATKLKRCGQGAAVWWSDDDQKVHATHALCKSRLCPTCSRLRAKRNLARLLPIVEQMDSPKKLEISLKSSHQPLLAQLYRLVASFRRLRQRKLWKSHFVGGVWCVEVTYNPATDQWHPHIHCIIDGTPLRIEKIWEMWREITGDSDRAYIRRIDSRRAAAAYVTDYVTKSLVPPNCPPHRLAEFARDTERLRMIQTFGTIHKSTPKDDEQPRPKLSEHLAATHQIIDAATDGDADARAILAALQSLRSADHADSQHGRTAQITTRHSTIADQIRAWKRHTEASRHDHMPRPPDAPAERDHPDLWTERQRQVAVAQDCDAPAW